MSEYAYENVRRWVYGDDGTECEGATFIPVCPNCGRFVKADATMQFIITPREWFADVDPVEPNATCSKCGRVGMIFEGFHPYD